MLFAGRLTTREGTRQGERIITRMRRKLFFGLLTVGLFVAGFGAASFPALAELRVITIKLVGGQRITTTVDVPPGTPVNQIQLPEISAPIEGVQEGAPKNTPRAPSAGTTGPTSDVGTGKRHESSPRKTRKHEEINTPQAEPQPEPKKKPKDK